MTDRISAAKLRTRNAVILVGMVVVLSKTSVPIVAATVLSFGSNNNGATGLATDTGNTPIAMPIDTTQLAGRTITQVAAGTWHSLLLSEDGTVFAFGHNAVGRTGLGVVDGKTIIATPIDMSNLPGRKISQISAGENHSLLLADDGTVFAFGLNGYGRTGLGLDSGVTSIATPIDATNLGGRRIVQIAAGSFHNLLLAEDGSVFSFGLDANGRTGLGTGGVTSTLIATPIDATKLGGKKITQVAVGSNHSLLLADDGSVFSFGSNSSGATAQGAGGQFTLVASSIDTTYITDKKIIQLAAGVDHSLFLAEDGTVFASGNNFQSQLGLGYTGGFIILATPIDTSNLTGKSIVQLAAGSSHSLILTNDGEVFSFGSNQSGVTGLGITDGNVEIATPIDASLLGGLRVSGISAGSFHNLLLAVPEPNGVILAMLGGIGIAMPRGRVRSFARRMRDANQ